MKGTSRSRYPAFDLLRCGARRGGLRARICQNMRGGAACRPNDKLRGGCGLSFPAHAFFSKCAHCLCLLVVDNLIALCVCDSVCFVHGCTCASNTVVHYHVCVRAHRCRAGIRVPAFIYVIITCASQVHGVLINDMLPVTILVT